MTAAPSSTGSVDLVGARWHEVTVPGSEPAVRLVVLGSDPLGGVTMMVRFPPGWERPGPGYYDVAEEVLFLAGAFEMSGQAYRADDHATFPPGFGRTASRSPSGALALAWFSGPQEWHEGVSSVATAGADGEHGTRCWWPESQPAASPLGPQGRPLSRTATIETWILDAPPPELTAPAGWERTDVFDLATHRYASYHAGERLEHTSPGPCWLRVLRPH